MVQGNGVLGMYLDTLLTAFEVGSDQGVLGLVLLVIFAFSKSAFLG